VTARGTAAPVPRAPAQAARTAKQRRGPRPRNELGRRLVALSPPDRAVRCVRGRVPGVARDRVPSPHG
jgi:hypothetical protein